MASTSPGTAQPAQPLGRERVLRWTLGSRRLRLDCTGAVVLGAAAVATGSFLAGALLLVVFVPLTVWTAKAASEHELIEAFEREQEAKRLLARLEPDLAAAVQQRLGSEPAQIAWDTSDSIAPPA